MSNIIQSSWMQWRSTCGAGEGVGLGTIPTVECWWTRMFGSNAEAGVVAWHKKGGQHVVHLCTLSLCYFCTLYLSVIWVLMRQDQHRSPNINTEIILLSNKLVRNPDSGWRWAQPWKRWRKLGYVQEGRSKSLLWKLKRCQCLLQELQFLAGLF